MISETSSIYALHYAKELGLELTLVHIKGQDICKDVKKSSEDLKYLATSLEVDSDFLVFENLDEFKEFVNSKDVDMLFCSTRHNHSILDKSFVQTLIKKDIKVDLSVVKVVKLGRADSIDSIILPIRDSKLSVKKFTLFSAFAKAYSSKSEIYSVDKVSPISLSHNNEKEKLQNVIFNLRHYFRISKMMNFKFSVKHDSALGEGERVEAHIARHGYDLAIVGAHHDKSFFGQHPIDILFENPMINTIYFIPHKDNL